MSLPGNNTMVPSAGIIVSFHCADRQGNPPRRSWSNSATPYRHEASIAVVYPGTHRIRPRPT